MGTFRTTRRSSRSPLLFVATSEMITLPVISPVWERAHTADLESSQYDQLWKLANDRIYRGYARFGEIDSISISPISTVGDRCDIGFYVSGGIIARDIKLSRAAGNFRWRDHISDVMSRVPEMRRWGSKSKSSRKGFAKWARLANCPYVGNMLHSRVMEVKSQYHLTRHAE